jgi:hypothetical protein
MPIDPDNAKDRERLHTAIVRSHSDWKNFRERRQDYIKRMVGSDYAAEAPKILLPKIHELVSTLVYKFCAKNPQTTVETEYALEKPQARSATLAINRRLEEICYAETLAKTMCDAAFLFGVQQTHNGEKHPLDFGDGYTFDPGKPTICHVPFDDFFADTTASCPGECRFIGKFYRIERQALLDDPKISKDAKDQIETLDMNQPEVNGEQHNKALSQGEGATAELLTPHVELMCVYLVQERKVITLARYKPELPPLRVTDWTGGPAGPFRFLRFTLVPDQIVPMSPVMVIAELERAVNELGRKAWQSADIAKTNFAFPPSAAADAELLRKAAHGDFLKMNRPDSVVPFTLPGPDQGLQSFMLGLDMAFNEGAGNLKQMAGTATSADTVGQEQLLYGAASQREAHFQNTLTDFMRDVISDLLLLMSTNEFYESENFYNEGPLQMRYRYGYGEPKGKLDVYKLKIEPYSTVHINPSQKFQAITGYMNNVLLPALQFQQVLDIGALNEKAAQYLNEPFLRDLYKPPSQPLEDPNNFPSDGAGSSAGKPNGQYTRINQRAPGADEYQTKQVQQAMLKGPAQPARVGARTG